MRYAGSIPENTIHVQDILFASAGAIAEAPGRRFLLREKPNGAVMLAYEVCDGEELLVGFNALSVGADEAGQAEDELGVLRKEVFRNAVR